MEARQVAFFITAFLRRIIHTVGQIGAHTLNRGECPFRSKKEYGTNGMEREKRKKKGINPDSVCSVLFRVIRTLSFFSLPADHGSLRSYREIGGFLFFRQLFNIWGQV
jgi:hypothetical protein